MNPRRFMALGATITVIGIAVAGTAPVVGTAATERVQGQQTLGGVVVLVGWGLLVWGIHRLGREPPQAGPP